MQICNGFLRAPLSVGFALLCAAFFSGCAFQTMTPAHQLDKGELVIQGSLDAPGFLYIPRLSGAVTYGFGGGDISGHLGTTALTANIGGEGRVYLGRAMQAGLEVDGSLTTFEEDFFSSGQRLGFISFTPRLGWTPARERDFFYGGFQAMAIVPISVSDSADLPNRLVVGAGGYVGLAFDTPGNIDFQVELSATPVGTYPEDDARDSYVLSPLPIAQFGIALQYRKEKDKPPMRPTPEPDREDPRIY